MCHVLHMHYDIIMIQMMDQIPMVGKYVYVQWLMQYTNLPVAPIHHLANCFNEDW